VVESYFTDVEWRQLARISKSTSLRWRQKGIGPRPIKVGPKAIRYPASEVNEYLAQNTARENA